MHRCKQEDASAAPALLVLSALSSKSLLQSSPLPENIKSQWRSESNSTENLLPALSELNARSAVWDLAQDPQNLLAIRIIKEGSLSGFYECVSAVLFLDRNSWASETELKNLVLEFAGTKAYTQAFEKFKKLSYVYCVFR